MLARRAKDLERGKVLALDSEHQAGAGEGGFPGDPEVLAFQAIRRGGGHFLPLPRQNVRPPGVLVYGPGIP